MKAEPDTHFFFWGSSVLSQWHRSSFTLNGVDYVTAEQAMMYGKAKLFDDDEIAQQILETRDARKQKSLGRKVRGFDPVLWDKEKFRIVCDISFAKFDQNDGLRRKLFQTGNREIVEASPHDLIWGIGLDEATARITPVEQWPGENLLGKALDKARDLLVAKYSDVDVKVEDGRSPLEDT